MIISKHKLNLVTMNKSRNSNAKLGLYQCLSVTLRSITSKVYKRNSNVCVYIHNIEINHI